MTWRGNATDSDSMSKEYIFDVVASGILGLLVTPAVPNLSWLIHRITHCRLQLAIHTAV